MPLFGKKNNDKNNEKDKVNDTAKAEAVKEVKEEKAAAAVPSENENPAPAPAAGGEKADSTADASAHEGGEIQVKRPKYVTPEGFEFNRYFLAERRIMLENVSYETTRPAQGQGQFKLGVKDTIVAQVIAQAGVKVTYNRTLRFDPEGPFVLSVSFAVMIVFNPGTKNEIDWRTIDVADEFKKNCPVLVQQMSAKAALLVAEITNAGGGIPIIPSR